jgi:hypothetical protein
MANDGFFISANELYQLCNELERLQTSLQLCSDSLLLHGVCELYAVSFTLKDLTDKAYDMLNSLKTKQEEKGTA